MKINEITFEQLLKKEYNKFFAYNLLVEEKVSESENTSKVNRAKKRLYKKYGQKAKLDLTCRILESPTVIKARNCRYRSIPGTVIIYYDFLTDQFVIGDAISNELREFSVANSLNYTEIFKYKSILTDAITADLTDKEVTDRLTEPLPKELAEDEDQPGCIVPPEKDFSSLVNAGLPEVYNIRLGCWNDAKNQLIGSFDPTRFTELNKKWRKSSTGFIIVSNDIIEVEAITILQAEKLNLVSGATRSDPNLAY